VSVVFGGDSVAWWLNQRPAHEFEVIGGWIQWYPLSRCGVRHEVAPLTSMVEVQGLITHSGIDPFIGGAGLSCGGGGSLHGGGVACGV
jgi:hypothetical protein